MEKPYPGGCACGALRYECSKPPMCTWICHCRECQRSTGTGGAVNVVFATSAVTFTRGAPKFHNDIGASGEKTYRGFCAERGSPIAAKADLLSQIHGISAASLDEPAGVKLAGHIWTSRAQPWDYLEPALYLVAGTPSEADLAEFIKRTQQG